MMEDSKLAGEPSQAKRVAPLIAAVVLGCLGVGYAVHEHNNAQDLASQNAQMTAQLKAERSQLDTLTAKVNDLVTASQPKPAEMKPSPAVHTRAAATSRRAGVRLSAAQDARFKKMQSQLDAQGKAIDDTKSDLANARNELGSSIARTHGELVVLQRKGERNYYEFDIQKSKEFRREGPLNISLRKANTKRQYADLMLIVEDRNLQQKHVNLYQPVMYYSPDSPQPVEIVINSITKDHIHGYVSAPKYKQSELASMANTDAGPVQTADQASNSTPQPARRKLTVPPDPDSAQ